ncbi:MAG: DUF3299 domain-containing protein [Chromatiaceae bacterium]|jgi:hypothetical protein|nr:DUF3299 domain-containing protein [Chromatiaceae bacterium]
MSIDLRLLIVSLAAASLLGACSEDHPPNVGAPPQATTSAAPAATDLRGPAQPVSPASTADDPAGGGAGTPRELEWDALMPDDFSADRLFSEYKVDEMADDDPRAAEFMAKLKDLMDKAPARDDLDGVEVKLPGFVVPVEADAKETTRFLLVPYYGACIHVPPPPANQTVYVITEAGKGTRPELFDVVWVTGTMSVKRIENDVAEAGYTLYASRIEPYE